MYRRILWELVVYPLGSAEHNSEAIDSDDFNPRPLNLYYSPTYVLVFSANTLQFTSLSRLKHSLSISFCFFTILLHAESSIYSCIKQ